MTDRLTRAEERAAYWFQQYQDADRARQAAVVESRRSADVARRAAVMLSTVRADYKGRLAAVVTIASALEDALPGDNWFAANAIKRLAAGEIDAETALKEAWADE